MKNYFYRYDFFTIWPNGFDKIDEILQIIRAEKDISILSIQKFTVHNMRSFVTKLYGCDSVPMSHLETKLKYLYYLSPKVINIFVENYNPQEIIVGMPPFRKKQCQNIVGVKNKIRNLYNPKHIDPQFQILPLDRGVSHEHIVHASDYEEQVDYYLKLLGHKEGLTYLEKNDYGLSFYKPFHIPRPSKFLFTKIPISSLFANILDYEKSKVIKTTTKIENTPHYKALRDEMGIYGEYLLKFRFTYLQDDYSIEKFISLKSLNTDQFLKISPILVTQVNGGFCILDGVHRAAISLYKNIKKINCVVFE